MAMAIMIQGTMSNVGKSLITGGLCRVFKQDGYRVAPFKSQNMALNSFITNEGLEMGRAQVMQAEAAGIEPSVLMNPILLKPTNDMGSQVIVNGKPVGDMSAKDYYKNKLNYVPYIMDAYNTLASMYDIIVIEGAGSPAEINLKQNDIVNMGMAKMAGVPVVLVGDIDRGGVFAQLLGTIDLLEEDEKSLVKGLIVNKFRGDKTILQPGIDMLEQRGGKRVLGIVPYINCHIDDEDSLSQRFEKKPYAGMVDIAVIRLPRISNFTDFNVFEFMDGVSLRYVNSAAKLGSPDMVIIPGTKNTISDLLWLRENGIEARIKQLAARGCPVFGICGGYQMLGEYIADESCAEQGGSIQGMGLLPVSTVFSPQKKTTRVSGIVQNADGIFACLKGQAFYGYEIHMGNTVPSGSTGQKGKNEELLCMNRLHNIINGEESTDGICRGNVYGTYVHGIFDSENISASIVKALLRSKGIENIDVTGLDINNYKQSQYDILADAVRNNIDMDSIYKILREGI